MIAECGLRRRVRMYGRKRLTRTCRVGTPGSIFVHPNRIERSGDLEGFGIVFLEAASAGLPSIGGNSGGVGEAIENGITGLLVSGTDAGELAEAILRLARSPELRHAMGKAGARKSAFNATLPGKNQRQPFRSFT